MTILTQHKLKVKVVGPPGKIIPIIDWDKFSGGDLTHSVTKVRATAGGPKHVLTGDSEVDNITVEAFIDPAAHGSFLAALKNGEKFEGTTISVYAIDNAGVQVGGALEYKGCSLAKYTPPQADANGEDAAKLVLEWAVAY